MKAKKIIPKLLIALGISGSVQFAAGMGGAEKVIAITFDDGFQSVAQNVPFRFSARWLLYIAGIRFVPLFPESLANLLAFFTSN